MMDNHEEKTPDVDHYPIRIPPDLLPEDVIEVMVGLCHELRHPLKKIEALTTILMEDDVFDRCPELAEEIQGWVGGIRYILDIVAAYDQQRENSSLYDNAES